MTKKQKDFFNYVNPIVWMKGLCSYLLTSVLLFNHFFVFILLLIIASLFALFGYDRYAARTYDQDTTSEFLVGSFAHSSAYDSPLKQGDKNLSSELSSFYTQEARIKERKKEEQRQAQEKEQYTSSNIKDQQPIWNKEDAELLSIHQEVNNRISDIKKSVQKRQK